MKVSATIKRHKDSGFLYSAGNVFEIRKSTIDYCCDEMESAFNTGHIKFGEFDSMCNKDSNVNIFDVAQDPIAIRLCPFCGEEIEIVLIEAGAI